MESRGRGVQCGGGGSHSAVLETKLVLCCVVWCGVVGWGARGGVRSVARSD